MKKANGKTEKLACRCCAVYFDATICAQCQTAGCAANTKSQKCRLAGTLQAGMKMSPHQLQMAYADLKTAYDKLLPEAQRLARLVHHYETTAVTTALHPDAAAAAREAVPA